MRKAMGVAAGAAIALAGGAWVVAWAADTSTSSVTLSGSVNNTCGFASNPTESLNNNAVLTAPTASAPVITFNVANPTTAFLNTAKIRLTYPAICNYSPTTLSLKTTKGGMIVGAAPAATVSGFLTRIDYEASASWGTAAAIVMTNGTQNEVSNSSTINAPRNTSLQLTIDITGVSTPLIAGTYTDTLTLQIGVPL